jgi:asparagine N-glycosylation enzyme membrane subunit Stt3
LKHHDAKEIQKQETMEQEQPKNYGEFKLNLNGLGTPNALVVMSFIALILALALKFDARIPYIVLSFAVLVGYVVFKTNLRKDTKNFLVPLLLICGGYMSYKYTSTIPMFSFDYYVFGVMFALFAAGASLALAKKISFDLAAVSTLLVIALIIHVSPSITSDIMSNIDSYWHYKWMLRTVNEQYLPEYDPLVYPMRGGTLLKNNYTGILAENDGFTFGLSEKNSPFLNPLTYAGVAVSTQPFGFTTTQIAIIFSGVLGALSVVMMYLLMKEIFFGMEPKNQIAAFFAAFMFMLSPAFGMNSLSTNMKDANIGMFFMLAAMFFFFASYHRKSFGLSILCGISFLMLRMGWANGIYGIFSIGVFGTLYSLACFMRNKSSITHIPYFIAPLVFYQLSGVFQHARGEMIRWVAMSPMEMYPILLTIGLGIILEMVRLMRNGEMILTSDDTLEGRTLNAIERNIKPIGLGMIVLALLFLTFYRGPMDFVNFIIAGLKSAGSWSVVHQTVAEQNPMATSLSEYMSAGYEKYGVSLYLGLLMLIPLIYLAIKEADIRALFLLSWAVPIMWGAYGKSSWIFASSAPAAALGASMLLFIATTKEEFNTLRVIPTILLLIIPATYLPIIQEEAKSPGVAVMHMTYLMDNYYWYPMLEWHRDHTPEGAGIVTWWDYGHWITSVAKRPVVADPLQVDNFEIQDLSHFFMNETTEEGAFNIIKQYDAAYKVHNPSWGMKYVSIDWTMIGKGSALHYIATSDMMNMSAGLGSWKNYGMCGFLPEQSDLQARVVTTPTGAFEKVQTLAFGCNSYIGGILFNLGDNGIKSIEVVDGRTGNRMNWNVWSKANDISLLGVQPFLTPNTKEGTPSIIQCAMNYNNPQAQVCRLPQFTQIVIVPQEFHDFMLTRLYLGKYMEEYKTLGMYNHDIVPLKHFREVPDYDGNGMPDGEFTLGYVRSYEILYDNSTEVN